MTAPPPTARSALALACLLGGSSGWAMTAAGAGAAGLATGYDVGLVAIGFMTTALAIPYAALQMPAGSFVDRVGVQVAAVLGLTLVVLAHLAASTTPLLWLACSAARSPASGTPSVSCQGPSSRAAAARGHRGWASSAVSPWPPPDWRC